MRFSRLLAVTAAVATGALAARCGSTRQAPPPLPASPNPDRCKLDLSNWVSEIGRTAEARPVESIADLIGGDAAQGQVGDFLLANERIRVIVQKPGRHIGPNPWGGQIIDADLVRPSGPGRDSFGKLGLLHSFGRTVEATAVEVVRAGAGGGAAVLVADGKDTVNDYFNLKHMIGSYLPGSTLVVDPDVGLDLRVSTYYVLNPGESRVQVVSAFCNDSREAFAVPVGDLTDSGGTVEFFQPRSCTGGFGYGSSVECLAAEAPWYGFLGDGVAYGWAPYKPSSLVPSTRNLVLMIAGVAGTLVDLGDKEPMEALLGWVDASVVEHPGELVVPASGSAYFARDFVVGRDLGAVSTTIHVTRNQQLAIPLGDVRGLVNVGGRPAAGARVVFERDVPSGTATRHVVETVFTTAEDGTFGGRLPAADYQASAWAEGTVPTAGVAVTVASGGRAERTFALAAPRTLGVSVRDPDGEAMPGKITVLCDADCPAAWSRMARWTDVARDPLPDNVAAQVFAGPDGEASILLSPSAYRVVVTRGPEFSPWPSTWAPADASDASTGAPVDLAAGDARVTAVLARVVTHPGWVSADLHVHAVNSPDAYVANLDRVRTFMAEGVDVLVSTDHDFITDYWPAIRALGGERFLATAAGQEITSFDYGHWNAWPFPVMPEDVTGGAVDWAGAAGPSLSPPQAWAAARARGATTVQINHPRGGSMFTAVRLDTDTGATHADPLPFRIGPQDGATPSDTRLFSADFDSLELLNGPGGPSAAKFNDWFTFLSRGLLVAGTGVSDTHKRYVDAAGYGRTLVQAGFDGPATFDAARLSQGVNAMRAVGTTAPFVQLTAWRLDAGGARTGAGVGIGGTLATGGDDVELEVDVQVAPWLHLDRIELVTHVPGGDVPCAVEPDFTRNPRSRVACDGVANTNWPAEGIAGSAAVAAGDVVLEKAVEKGAGAWYRARVTKTFRLAARPTADSWFVALVHGKGTMFPLNYGGGVSSSTHRGKNAAPFAFTNPVLLDADGGGYDKPPEGKMAIAR